jgi:general secretion pathway protein D
MFGLKRLAIWALVFVCLASTGDARTKKGDKFLKDGQQAEIRKQWEAALDLYEKALLEDPADAGYMLATRRVRFQAGMGRVDAGQKLRSQGQLAAALAEFQKAYAIDPSSSIAEQEIKRTKEMIDREASPGGKAATPEDRGLSPAEKAQQEVEEKVSRMLPVPELKPLNPQPLNLKMNNQPVKVLFDTVGKLAGINVVFDNDYQPAPGKDRFTVDLSNTTLEEALDNLAIQTKSYWKALSPNTIFVTNDNVTKRRDYEDYVVKVFYIKNVTTIQELQEISVTIRSVTEIRRAYTYNPLNAILLRGTAEQIALAEKLISDLDKPKAEVVIDVIVMEANRGRIRDLGANLTFGGSNGINLPIFYGSKAPSTGTGTGTGTGTDTDTDNGNDNGTAAGPIPLNRIKSLGLGDFSTVVPGGLLQALMSDSQTKIVQQPQVRAVDNYKASLKIGDRVPYATGSFQPGSLGGGVGISPLVSTQFNYIDTGVNVEIVPRVHGRDEVSLHVEIDLNNVTREVDLGGLKQPLITQKKIVHDIRLKQGEVNLLGGLLGVQDTRTVSGIPGLANIPVLGRLFGPEHTERNRGELLIAIIPHVVRAPDFTESNFRGVAAGPDANLKLNYAPRPVPAAPAPGAAAPAGPAATVPATTAPVTPPATATPAPAEPAPAAPAPATPKPEAEATAQAAPAGGPRLVFTPGTVQTPLSSAVTVQLMVENVSDLSAAPLRIKFDPKVLKLTSIRPGSLMSGDGAKVNFTENIVNDAGEATVTLNRTPGTGSVSGSGALLNLTFQATGRGSSAVSVVDAALKNLQMQPIAVQNPSVNIQVQ